MRAICNVCKDKSSCSYLKQGKERDCIDVQTSDYGYEEAVEKAYEWLDSGIAFMKFLQVKDAQSRWEFIQEFRRKMLENH